MIDLDKLAAQSLVYVDTELADGKELIFSKEKFAQLIVQECCQVLSKESITHNGYGYNQHALYQKLREHIGVEE